MSDTARATFTGYVVQADGPDVYLMDGQEYPADHPLVVARPDLFVRTGGIVDPGVLLNVGEAGPEVTVPDGATVTPPRRGRNG